MALQSHPLRLSRSIHHTLKSSTPYLSRRHASTQAADAAAAPTGLEDLEPGSSLAPSSSSIERAKAFDPLQNAKARKTQLPSSRYKFRSPRYDSGPLHPHRPPPPSNPASRLFVPGPFSAPRTEQTYHSTIASDIMTLAYVHNPPGFKPPPKAQRLRSWDDSSPYHKNRQLRGPRGGDVLRLLRKPINFNHIPKLEGITVHSYMKGVTQQGSQVLHVGGMVVQAITNVRVNTHKSRTGVANWGISKGRDTIAVTAEMKGEDMYHFMGKLVDVVLPKIKDWKGVKGTAGDGSGNITFGLDPEVVAMFPEIEVNYDMYPVRLIPGCHITIKTSARTDKDARMLLGAMGIPFYGKMKL